MFVFQCNAIDGSEIAETLADIFKSKNACIVKLPIVCGNLAKDQAGEAITMASSAVELWF